MKIYQIGRVAVVMLIFLIVMLFNTHYHESVHKQIMLYFGCKNATITMGVFGGETECAGGYHERTSELHDKEFTLHSQNEIVGYNLQTMFLLMFVIITLQVIQIERGDKSG